MITTSRIKYDWENASRVLWDKDEAEKLRAARDADRKKRISEAKSVFNAYFKEPVYIRQRIGKTEDWICSFDHPILVVSISYNNENAAETGILYGEFDSVGILTGPNGRRFCDMLFTEKAALAYGMPEAYVLRERKALRDIEIPG